MVAVGAPLLGAVQDVAVTPPHRGGPEARRVRAGAGLRERVRGEELARRQARQVLRLLRLGAGQEDRQAAERLVEILRRGRRARPGDLLAHEREGEASQVGPAVLLGQPDAVEAGVADCANRFFGVRLGRVVMGRVRRHALARDRAREVADQPLVLGQVEPVVHGDPHQMIRRRRRSASRSGGYPSVSP